MKIPDEKIQEIREASDLVETISQYVTLKRRGKGFFGLCHFHSEKTPSLAVYANRAYCFGACREGWDLYGWLMKRDNLTFPEALRSAAQRAGLTPPKWTPE